MWEILHPETECVFSSKNLPMRRPKVPQQSNGSDCGVFVLHFIEKFAESPTHNMDDVCIRIIFIAKVY